MNKLLTDDELLKELHNIQYPGTTMPLDLIKQANDDGPIKRTFALIQSQKIAHGEMVIGENALPVNRADHSRSKSITTINFEHSIRNDLKSEQRERNK